MRSYAAQIRIGRPADEVFAFLAHYDQCFQWVGSVVKVERIPPGPVLAGTKFNEHVRLGRVENQVLWEVTVYEPPRRIVFSAKTFLGHSSVVFECNPVEDGTLLHAETSGELKGFYRLLWPALKFIGRRDRKKHLARIKEILENR